MSVHLLCGGYIIYAHEYRCVFFMAVAHESPVLTPSAGGAPSRELVWFQQTRDNLPHWSVFDDDTNCRFVLLVIALSKPAASRWDKVGAPGRRTRMCHDSYANSLHLYWVSSLCPGSFLEPKLVPWSAPSKTRQNTLGDRSILTLHVTTHYDGDPAWKLRCSYLNRCYGKLCGRENTRKGQLSICG